MKLASITAITVATSLAVWLARAHALEPQKDEPHTLAIQVGGTVKLCRTGTIVCPACAVICDDLSVAAPEYGGPDGLAPASAPAWRAVAGGWW